MTSMTTNDEDDDDAYSPFVDAQILWKNSLFGATLYVSLSVRRAKNFDLAGVVFADNQLTSDSRYPWFESHCYY